MVFFLLFGIMFVGDLEENNISSIKVHESVGFKNFFMKWNEIDEGFLNNYLGFIIKYFF